MSDDRGTNRSAEAYVVSMAPDVCKTPLGSTMVPVPYTITCKFDVAQATATRTRFGGQPVFTMSSYLPTVQGDEPGIGGGLISGVNLGACRPVEHSKSVRVEGQWLVRHSDLMAMNCAGPKGTGNTYGKIVYIGVKTSARVGPDGEIIHQTQTSRTDPQTGETITETTTVGRDPETGLVTRSKEITAVNPETGRVESGLVTEITDPVTGDCVHREAFGNFDPSQDSYRWHESTTTLPGPGIGIEGMRTDEIGAKGRPAEISRQPSMESPFQTDPSVSLEETAVYAPTTDPEYQQALEEQRQAEAEIAAVEQEIAREAIKAGVDAAGLLDPTPTSDLISAGMSVAEGDFWGAGLSIISAVPYFGDAIAKPIKATRMARKAAKLAGKLKKLKAKAAKLAEKLRGLRKGKKPKPGKGADGGNIPGRTAKDRKAEQLKKNKKQGKLREEEVRRELEEEGHEVLGSQVSVKTPESRRQIDHLIRDKNTGEIRAIEVKSGNATRNAGQIAKDAAMEKTGGKIIGKNAPKELKDRTLRIPTEVRR
ncbi:PAAR-like domain-containing protein [Candidatus Thiosymbion oneisti]|uniref:PAAR-like domain-containing protein n=1 Tax=Candidatus Thiosymbion oneisti TaxID=589554 RepID=UPI00106003F9|nr:PAAR-like domain-containing protein [Candidatus Thiosymbion oneisti]